MVGAGSRDAAIDTGRSFVRHVEVFADALGARGGRYVFVSSASVYDVPGGPGFTESAPLVEVADTTIESIDGFTAYGDADPMIVLSAGLRPAR